MQTFDFLLTFIKVTGIVSLYISLQLSQTWSLGLFGDGSLLVRAINSISASHMQLTPLFTTIKYELRISYGGNAVIYEDEGSAGSDLLRRNDELGRRQTERLVRFPSSSGKKNSNQESFKHQQRLWCPALAFVLEYTTFLRP